MKLLYKGSECGVPCTCPSAEDEYVWWEDNTEHVESDNTSATVSFRFSTDITVLKFRITANDDSVIQSLQVICRFPQTTDSERITMLTHATSYTFNDGLLVNGVPFYVWSKPSNVYEIRVTYTNMKNFTISNVGLLLSKEDYAKLVEASGS